MSRKYSFPLVSPPSASTDYAASLQVLKVLRFSKEFRNQMALPLVALFFGTGNQTPNVAAAVIARVFLDPDLRLFDYCPQRLLNSVPVSHIT